MIIAADGFGQFYFVRPSGSDANLGTSWASPFQSIQKALTVASFGAKIFVEKGTYFVDEGFLAIDNSRTSTISLKNGVSLYGGFDPNNGIDDLNDVRTSKSRLSGDLAQNDFGVTPVLTDNAFHVVTSTGVGETTVFDGFAISDGNANGGGTFDWGGGMFNDGSSLIISNCDFLYNYAVNGAAVLNQNGTPTFNKCVMANNAATSSGGAIANFSSSAILNNCSLFNNTAITYGGGIYNTGSSPIITNTSVANNSAGMGGGISNRALSNPSFINCVIQSNAATINGGAIDNDQANPVLINTTITANSAVSSGGAIQNYQGNPIITNCILWNNAAPTGPEIREAYLSTSTVTYSIVKGGHTGTGNLDLDPLFSVSLNLAECSPAIDAGSNAAIPAGVLTDINGTTRIVNITVDMGALEYNVGTPITYYRDADTDTYGDPNTSKALYCSSAPSGWVANNTDCDDTNGDVHPGAEEICGNGVDDNCDGEIDEFCGGTGCTNDGTYYLDFDGDGWGNSEVIYPNPPCTTNIPGYVGIGGDCNDDDAAINPGAAEICGNGIDDNCNGQTDENCDPCGVFSNLTTTNINSTSATLNWVASTNPDQWQVQYKSTSKGSKWIDVPNVAPADRSVTINNLNRNQNYIWHLRAKCAKVVTKYSESIGFKTALNSNTSAALARDTQKDQLAQASALVIYPSPASHQFSIRLNLGTAVAAPVAIQLFDMNGKLVLSQSAGLQNGILQKQLSLPHSLINGLYLVRIGVDGKVFNRKLIVNK
ncbi:hypothetical protein HY58_00455 [Flavihumibacter sp. ZG627]|nr:hypothetical protein HY58_00455 [Flavihumibacter sp. ZG627]